MSLWRGKTTLGIFAFIILIFAASGNQISIIEDVEILTVKQHQESCLATLYIVDGKVPEEFPSKLQEFNAQLKLYNINVVLYKCMKESSTCPQETVIRLSIARNRSEDFSIDSLTRNDLILHHILSFCLTDDLPYTSNLEDWNRLVANHKGHGDIILFFTKEYGTRSHQHFLKVAYLLRNKYQFTQTTHDDHPGLMGLATSEDSALLYYKCREIEVKSKPCSFVKFNGQINRNSDIIRFILGQDREYKNVTMVSTDGHTPFDNLMGSMLPLNLIYVFLGAEEIERITAVLEAVSQKAEHFVYFIVADKDKHGKIATRLGALSQESPRLIAELRNFFMPNQTITEHWNGNFTETQILRFLDSLLNTPKQYFASQAARYGPKCLQTKTVQDHKVSLGTVIGACGDGDVCRSFEINLRRAVRTLYLSGKTQLYINFLRPITVPEKEQSESSPTLGYQAGEDQFFKFEDEMTYENILKFLVKSFSTQSVPLMPLSGSDLVPICKAQEESGFIMNKAPDYPEIDEDEKGIKITQSPGFLSLYGFNAQGKEKDYFESIKIRLSTEEDEVARDFAVHHKNKTFSLTKKGKFVKALTDKTYTEMLQSRGVFFVHYYIPWDARIHLFHAVYENVARNLEHENENKPSSVVLADVSCHDWPDVCEKANLTSYPLVRIFINGSAEGIYNGLLSEESLLRAVKLYQLPYLTRLTSTGDISGLTEGILQGVALPPHTVSVLALLSSEADITMFSSVAKKFFGIAVFAYVEGEVAIARAQSFGLQMPTVYAFSPEDIYSPLKIAPSFQREALIQFVKASLVPTFGEITEDNFPDYHQLSRPYLILFKRSREETPLLERIIEVAKTEITNRITLGWMDEEKPVTLKIKQSYVGSSEGPALVLVDHSKSAVYHYKVDQGKPIPQWINDCLDNKVQSQASFREGKWTPRWEGYNFQSLPPNQNAQNEKKMPKLVTENEQQTSARSQLSNMVEQSSHGRDEL